MALVKLFGMKEIAERAEKVFDELFTIEQVLKGNNVLMHKEAWDLAHKQLKEEFKPSRANWTDIGFEDFEGFELITYNLLKEKGETITKYRLLQLCNPIDKVRLHMVNTFEGYENISPKRAIVEVSKVNSELRKKFYEERDRAETKLGYRPCKEDM